MTVAVSREGNHARIEDAAAAQPLPTQPLPGGVRVRVNEALASSSEMRWARATSGGFARAASASIQARACVAIAEAEGEMARDAWHSVERREDWLVAEEEIARQAVFRASRKLGGRSVPTRTVPVVLDSRAASSLVMELVGGLGGAAQQQQSTFLAGAMGSQRLAAHVVLEEDPFEPFGLASMGWDSDGIAPRRRHIVRDGVIEGYFLNARTARKLGMDPTGNADGPTNLTLRSRLTGPGDDPA